MDKSIVKTVKTLSQSVFTTFGGGGEKLLKTICINLQAAAFSLATGQILNKY